MASLSKLGSTLGIPIGTDKHTLEKIRLSYARLLIDIPVEGSFLKFIDFVNDQDIVVGLSGVCVETSQMQSLQNVWPP